MVKKLVIFLSFAVPSVALGGILISTNTQNNNAVSLNDVTYDITGAWTLAGWAYWNGNAVSNAHGIFYKWVDATKDGFRLYMAEHSTLNKSSLWCWAGGGGGTFALAQTPDNSDEWNFPKNVWVFVACRYNPSVQLDLMYRTVTSTSWQSWTDNTSVPSSISPNNNTAQFGNDVGGDVTSWFGTLAHWRLYTRYLSNDEILNLMYKPVCANETADLLGAWAFDDIAYADECSDGATAGTVTAESLKDGPPVP